jgi:hypothetical protein
MNGLKALILDLRRPHDAARGTPPLRKCSDAADIIERLERENAALREALRGLKATFSTIHDRHLDSEDCDEDASGHRTPNSHMHTVVDCNVSIEMIDRALGQESARGGAPDLHLHDGPLICKVCATPVSGEGVTEDAGATWMHLRCFKPQPGGAGFKCCGAGDPPCTSFEVSCQNPANYADGERWCPKCKQPDFPFCATSGCLKVPKLAEPPQPGGTD